LEFYEISVLIRLKFSQVIGVNMRIAKFTAVLGVIFIMFGVLFAVSPATQENWRTKSMVLADDTVEIYTFFNKHTVILTYPFLKSSKDYRNIVVKGSIEGTGAFDLTIGQYVNIENATEYEFSFSPRPSEIFNGIKMVIVNRAMNKTIEDFIIDTVTLYSFMKSYYWFKTPLPIPARKVPVEVVGTAESKYKFNIYFMDHENFERWKAGLLFKAYFVGAEKSSYNFSFTVPAEKCDKELYYIIERSGPTGSNAPTIKVFICSKIAYLKPVDIKVHYHVEMTWEEKSYAHIFAGLALGAFFIILGMVLLIVALILKATST